MSEYSETDEGRGFAGLAVAMTENLIGMKFSEHFERTGSGGTPPPGGP